MPVHTILVFAGYLHDALVIDQIIVGCNRVFDGYAVYHVFDKRLVDDGEIVVERPQFLDVRALRLHSPVCRHEDVVIDVLLVDAGELIEFQAHTRAVLPLIRHVVDAVVKRIWPAIETVWHADEHAVGIALDDLSACVAHELVYEVDEHELAVDAYHVGLSRVVERIELVLAGAECAVDDEFQRLLAWVLRMLQLDTVVSNALELRRVLHITRQQFVRDHLGRVIAFYVDVDEITLAGVLCDRAMQASPRTFVRAACDVEIERRGIILVCRVEVP